MTNVKAIMRRKDLAVIVTLSWMGLIFYLSHQAASQSSELSGSFVDVILAIFTVLPLPLDPELVHFFVRKSAHFIAYCILGIFVLHTVGLFISLHIKALLLAFLICLLYAISDEVHQLFIPGRSGEVRDVLVDSAGSLTGIVTYVCVYTLYKKVSRGRQRRVGQ